MPSKTRMIFCPLCSSVFFGNRKGCFIHPKTVFHPFGFDGIHLVIRVFDKAGGKQILLDAARHFGVDPRRLRNERHARFHRFALQGCIRPIAGKLPIGKICNSHMFPPSSLLFLHSIPQKGTLFLNALETYIKQNRLFSMTFGNKCGKQRKQHDRRDTGRRTGKSAAQNAECAFFIYGLFHPLDERIAKTG